MRTSVWASQPWLIEEANDLQHLEAKFFEQSSLHRRHDEQHEGEVKKEQARLVLPQYSYK